MTEKDGGSTATSATPPGARPTWRRRGWLLGCLIVIAIFLAAPLVALFLLDRPSGSGPEIASVASGAGGSVCTIERRSSQFEVGTPVHVVLSMSPPIPAGSKVVVTLRKDGVEFYDTPDTVAITEPAPCISSTFESLPPGHYRVEYALTPTTMPPFDGEFDVVP
jgi:hypothetical protein